MEKKLPITIPSIECYQGSSFILGIISAHERIANAFYNNYINWVCNDTDLLSGLDLDFAGITWEDYRLAGIAEMDMYYLRNIPRDKFVDFIRERIDQDNYLLFYKIDEYYLSYTNHYGHRHYMHDAYVYGYNDTNFLVMAYHDKRLQLLEVSVEEIMDGLYYVLEEEETLNFCSFRPYHAASVQVDYDRMVGEFEKYVSGVASNADRIYGVSVYEVLIKCIWLVAEGIVKGEDALLEPKVFRMLWEHKKILLVHLEKLKQVEDVKRDILEEMQEIVQSANKVFMLALKYNITFQNSILHKIMGYIREIQEREQSVLKQFLCGRN